MTAWHLIILILAVIALALALGWNIFLWRRAFGWRCTRISAPVRIVAVRRCWRHPHPDCKPCSLTPGKCVHECTHWCCMPGYEGN